MLTSDLIKQLDKPEYKDYKVLFRSERTYSENDRVPICSVDYLLIDDKLKCLNNLLYILLNIQILLNHNLFTHSELNQLYIYLNLVKSEK
jgi:hypothetical protein